MTRRTRSDQRSGIRGFSIAGVALLALGVSALAVMAYEHGNPEVQAETAGPAPVFTLGVQVTPTPSAPPAPAPTPETPREERFLAIGTSAWWRATSPACGEGEPLLERSTDAGASWSDVTPRYLDVREILALEPFLASEAEIVAARGGGCGVEALRTFTQGEFWSPYPEVLSASTYLDESTIHRRGTPTEAPCANPHGLQAAGDTLTVVCDGRALALTDAGWWTSPTVGVVDAAPVGEQIAVAALTDDCAGVEVSRETPGDPASESLVCVPTDSTEIALTISPSDSGIVLWAGDVVTQVR